MHARGLLLLTFLLCATVLFAESSGGQGNAPNPPQTARQALLEMFFDKSPGTFLKHLPAATRAALDQAGAAAGLNQYALFTGQIQSQQKNLQTFETGSVLMSSEDPKTAAKVEVIVENDSLLNDQDDIALSFQTYRNGVAQRTPFLPRMTFSMKLESGIWKLNEIAVTIRLPLADPDLLKTIGDAVKSHSATSTSLSPNPGTLSPSPQTGNNEIAVVTAMRTIINAETTYAATYRTIGYTCALSDLDGFGGGERNEHQAMLINAGLAGGKRYGYVFALSQCGGSPAPSFHLTAVPSGNGIGRRAYCADQAGAVRYSADGNAAGCIESGTSLP